MKLAIVTNILSPYRIPLFEQLARLVDELTVVLMAEKHANRHWDLPAHRFRTVTLPGIHLSWPGLEKPYHLNRGVIRVLRKLNPDCVVSGGFTLANVSAYVYCKLFGKKYVGWGEFTLRDGAQYSVMRRLIRRALCKGSDGSIASSTVAAEAFAHYGANPKRTLLSVMPIDVEFYRRSAAQFRGSTEYHTLRGRFGTPVLLSIGRLVAVKGYPELFAIYERVLQSFPQASLLIIGEGTECATYKAQVAARGWRNVAFLGFQQAEQLVRCFAIADVFVFHTRFDPFGAVLSEAMAAGVPVVSSIHAAATRDLVLDGKTGFRIDPIDATRAAVVIERVLTMEPQAKDCMLGDALAAVRATDCAIAAVQMNTFLRELMADDRAPTTNPTAAVTDEKAQA